MLNCVLYSKKGGDKSYHKIILGFTSIYYLFTLHMQRFLIYLA